MQSAKNPSCQNEMEAMGFAGMMREQARLPGPPMNRWKSPSSALRAPSPPLGEKDGMRGFGSWLELPDILTRFAALNLVAASL
jgi:hypothetical protein